ncbi:MAG: DNA topoisomerase 1 [Candidatus Binatia bacterium]|nr:MAG: DNA topoisomerase 1 [Candidatus Binatia bacterium]
MAKNLVIVESPAKAKTLQKYLGADYQVKSSVGHIKDLPKSRLGVDVEHGFRPEYEVIHGKGKIVAELRKAAKDKDQIFLATDPDREGEAIAWHIAEELKKSKAAKGSDEDARVQRVLFHEITQRAVQEAMRNPRRLDRNLFEAQQARRVLDRLVGYEISPLLWEKVRRGLSAGRVQSVAVRLIVDREREIQKFQPKEYWSITARLEGKQPPVFTARLFRIGEQKLDPETFRIENEEAARELVERLQGAEFRVVRVEKKERRRFPAPPFTTSRLQQEAARKLGFTPTRTMRIAQRLYEGVELGPEGSVGLITYMRTDSTRISTDAQTQARSVIREKFGADYLPAEPPTYPSKKGAQDAHEAIRPTSLDYAPERVKPYLKAEEYELYKLIWDRFLASQMRPAVFDRTTVDIRAADTLFRATGQVMKFDGFTRVYTEGRDEEAPPAGEDEEANGASETSAAQLPPLEEGEVLRLLALEPAQHFTQPPPRFTQATLVKELEEKGIGRPSTYATIVGTILNREYVVEDSSKRLRPTELGFLVTDLLVQAFPDILNVEFTAGMEEQLDKVEEGKETWTETLRRFYEPFKRDLEQARQVMRDVKGGQVTEVPCPSCGAPMVMRWGRTGDYLACSKYPDCKTTRNFVRDQDGRIRIVERETTDETCPTCGKPMEVRYGRFGKFLGCAGYPECKTILPYERPKETGVQCPDCQQGQILEKRSRAGKTFFSCSRYPECRFATWDRPVPQPCPECGAPFVVEKTTKRQGTVRRCLTEGCGYRETVSEAVEDVL